MNGIPAFLQIAGCIAHIKRALKLISLHTQADAEVLRLSGIAKAHVILNQTACPRRMQKILDIPLLAVANNVQVKPCFL